MPEQNSNRMAQLLERAASNVAEERRHKYKFLPGDPLKGTLYKGFISKVEITTVDSQESENYGKELLVITCQVTDAGDFKGWEENFNRVLYPASLAEPTAEGWEKRTARVIEQNKNIDPAQARVKAEADWEKQVIQHYEYTLRQFEYIGVDTSSQDMNRMLAAAAQAQGTKAAWKVYDAGNGKPRRAYLEDAKRYFRDFTESAPNLFEDLPNGKDIPID